ncbi:MAG TPA: hypothetical protein VHE55_04510 [Fimbriimonadaceae bacterium]|nr:hypothetical protein [Fimbriimonadaceae bacterium]
MSTPSEQPNPIPPETKARIQELQALITEHQRKADKAEDEDIREAHNLQVSKLGLKVARLRHGQPEELPSEVEKAIEEEFEPLPKPTPAQLEEADQLIRRSALERRRGNNSMAGDLLKKALEVAPGSAMALEALGDDLMERKQFGAAQEAYRTAHRADPENPNIERKLAQLSMKGFANLSIEDQLRMGSFDSPLIQQSDAVASPKVAVILSVFFPGSGQLVLGYSKKGIAILLIWLVSTVLFVVLATKLRTGHHSLPTIAYFPLGLSIATWLVGVADVSMVAKGPQNLGGTGGASKPSKPVPPVNLPFE